MICEIFSYNYIKLIYNYMDYSKSDSKNSNKEYIDTKNLNAEQKALIVKPEFNDTLMGSVGISSDVANVFKEPGFLNSDKVNRLVQNKSDSIVSSIPGVTPNMMVSLKKIRETNPFFIWIYKSIYYILILFIIILINCNILFIIQNSTKDIIDKWFPSDGKEYPYKNESNIDPGDDEGKPDCDSEDKKDCPAFARLGKFVKEGITTAVNTTVEETHKAATAVSEYVIYLSIK